LAIDTPRDLNFLVSGLTTAGEFVVFALNEFAFLVLSFPAMLLWIDHWPVRLGVPAANAEQANRRGESISSFFMLPFN